MENFTKLSKPTWKKRKQKQKPYTQHQFVVYTKLARFQFALCCPEFFPIPHQKKLSDKNHVCFMIFFRLWKVLLLRLRFRANSKTCQQVKKRMFTLHIWWWWWCAVVVVFVVDDAMCCATPCHTSQHGLCISRFLNNNNTSNS